MCTNGLHGKLVAVLLVELVPLIADRVLLLQIL
jgi:hypothetical protein